MTAIPFGLVGAIWGHIMMGLDVTLISMFGLVGPDRRRGHRQLVMVDFINRWRERSGDRRRRSAKLGQPGSGRFC